MLYLLISMSCSCPPITSIIILPHVLVAELKLAYEMMQHSLESRYQVEMPLPFVRSRQYEGVLKKVLKHFKVLGSPEWLQISSLSGIGKTTFARALVDELAEKLSDRFKILRHYHICASLDPIPYSNFQAIKAIDDLDPADSRRRVLFLVLDEYQSNPVNVHTALLRLRDYNRQALASSSDTSPSRKSLVVRDDSSDNGEPPRVKAPGDSAPSPIVATRASKAPAKDDIDLPSHIRLNFASKEALGSQKRLPMYVYPICVGTIQLSQLIPDLSIATMYPFNRVRLSSLPAELVLGTLCKQLKIDPNNVNSYIRRLCDAMGMYTIGFQKLASFVSAYPNPTRSEATVWWENSIVGPFLTSARQNMLTTWEVKDLELLFWLALSGVPVHLHLFDICVLLEVLIKLVVLTVLKVSAKTPLHGTDLGHVQQEGLYTLVAASSSSVRVEMNVLTLLLLHRAVYARGRVDFAPGVVGLLKQKWLDLLTWSDFETLDAATWLMRMKAYQLLGQPMVYLSELRPGAHMSQECAATKVNVNECTSSILELGDHLFMKTWDDPGSWRLPLDNLPKRSGSNSHNAKTQPAVCKAVLH